jgi:hypothetical protein
MRSASNSSILHCYRFIGGASNTKRKENLHSLLLQVVTANRGYSRLNLFNNRNLKALHMELNLWGLILERPHLTFV